MTDVTSMSFAQIAEQRLNTTQPRHFVAALNLLVILPPAAVPRSSKLDHGRSTQRASHQKQQARTAR
jgi:hypothetical protein